MMKSLGKRVLRKCERVLRKRFAPSLSKSAEAPKIGAKPETETGRVIFCAFSERGFHGGGKVAPKAFFPRFCDVLHNAELGTYFVSTPRELANHLIPDACIVHIYNETGNHHSARSFAEACRLAEMQHTGIVFNAPELGSLIARKDVTNRLLTDAGIAVPRMLSADDVGVEVFCNDLDGSGAEVSRTFDPDRYNTEFIDTRVRHEGIDYYTTVRLLCVGGILIHCNIGARDTRETASVHGRDVPLDPCLLEFLQDKLVHSRRDNLSALARSLGDVLGPGFFGHDLVICSKTGVPYVCEAGFKFDARAYRTHLASISDHIPSHSDLFDGKFEALSARAFIAEHAALTAADRA